MICQQCRGHRVLSFSAKCNDAFYCRVNDNALNDYPPGDLGIGGGDYVRCDVCLDCGQLQGQWPLPMSSLEATPLEDEVNDESHLDWP